MKIVQPPRKRCKLPIRSPTQGVWMLSFHPCTTIAYFSLFLQPNCVNLVSGDNTKWSPLLEERKVVNKMRLSDNDNEKFSWWKLRVDGKLCKLPKVFGSCRTELKPSTVINEWKWECSCCCQWHSTCFSPFSFNYELGDLFSQSMLGSLKTTCMGIAKNCAIFPSSVLGQHETGRRWWQSAAKHDILLTTPGFHSDIRVATPCHFI